jgi:hypothetical protein
MKKAVDKVMKSLRTLVEAAIEHIVELMRRTHPFLRISPRQFPGDCAIRGWCR